MKHLIASILYLTLLPAMAFSADKATCRADEEGIVHIPVISEQHTEGTPIPKAPSKTLIYCEYLIEHRTFEFSFFADLGELAIAVANFSTGESYSISVDSMAGFTTLIISGNAGLYNIRITSSNGSSYTGTLWL